MNKDAFLAAIEEITESSKKKKISFWHEIDSLSIFARISECYRSYNTDFFILRWIFPKLRKFLFRETDFRYGLALKNQEDFNLHSVEVLRSFQMYFLDREKQIEFLEKSVDSLRTSLAEKEEQIIALRQAINTKLGNQDV